jgi:xylulokinase
MVGAGLAPPGQLRATGGGTRSRLWRQILADVLGTEVATVGAEEGAAYGAALLAAVGSGWFADVEEACRAVVEVRPAAGPSGSQDAYREGHARFRGLYPALAPTFHATPA